jgi:hypothetical protein
LFGSGKIYSEITCSASTLAVIDANMNGCTTRQLLYIPDF